MKYVKFKSEVINLSKVCFIEKTGFSVLTISFGDTTKNIKFETRNDVELTYEKIANFLQNENETFLEL